MRITRAQRIIEMLPAFDKPAMRPRAIGSTDTTKPFLAPSRKPPGVFAPEPGSGGDKGFGPMPTQSAAADKQEKIDKKQAFNWDSIYSR